MSKSGGHVKGNRSNPRFRTRRKKRKFIGNQFTAEKNTDLPSSSAKKLKTSSELQPPTDSSIQYVILCFNFFFSVLSQYIKCKKCDGEISFTQQKGRGLGFKVCLECSCGRTFIQSSPTISQNVYEINQRLIFVLRVLGIGYNGLLIFLILYACLCILQHFRRGFIML